MSDTKTIDYIHLVALERILENKNEVKISDIQKKSFGQRMLDNKFFTDLNNDGVVSSNELSIGWRWLAQGKPTSDDTISTEFVFPTTTSSTIKFTGHTTEVVIEDTLGLEGCSHDKYYSYGDIKDSGDGVSVDDVNFALNIITGEQDHPVENTLEHTLSNVNLKSDYTGLSVSELLRIDCISKNLVEADEYYVPASTELSSDFNQDGEVDEIDLKILERFILIQPSTLEEYNTDRGDYPFASCLPDLLTAKFQCPTPHEQCATPTPTPSILSDNTIRIKNACVNDNNLHISVEYNITQSTDLYIHLKPQELGGKTFSNLQTGNHVIEHTFENLDVELTQIVVFISDAGWNERIFAISETEVPNCDTPTPTPSFDCNQPHPDDLTINHGDYLIFKRWLEIEKPRALWKFNKHRDYAPEACRLPYNVYDDIGTITSSQEDIYTGIENL